MKNTRIELKNIQNNNCLKNCNKDDRKETTEDDLCVETFSVNDKLPVRCVGGWAIQKIYHLTQYFGIFTIGMKDKWEGKINYIEICSGPGRCICRDTGEEFNGTPLSIIEHDACKYLNKAIFIDYNYNVISCLNKRIENRKIENTIALWGDYYKPIELCDSIIKETKGIGLNMVFIDPTDCSVPFDLLKTIKTKLINVDFIVNFAIHTDVNRNLKNAILDQEKYKNAISKYIQFLGSDKFFSNPITIETAKKGNHTELRKLFREEYMNSLRRIGYSHFDFKQIENYYDLVFASTHKKGIEFWRKANEIGFDGQRSLF